MCSFQTETINGFDTTNWLLRYKCYFDATSIKCKSPMIHHNSKQTFTAAGVSDFLFRTSVARFLAHTSKYLDVPWLLMFSSQGVPVTQVAWCRSPSQSKYAIENIQFFWDEFQANRWFFRPRQANSPPLLKVTNRGSRETESSNRRTCKRQCGDWGASCQCYLRFAPDSGRVDSWYLGSMPVPFASYWWHVQFRDGTTLRAKRQHQRPVLETLLDRRDEWQAER